MGEVLITKCNSDPWQTTIKSIHEKWVYIWQNSVFSDLIFKVGPSQVSFSCHRILLIIHSPVFETMLSQRWSDSKVSSQLEIILPEEDSEIFKIFLEFIYTGRISATEVEPLVSTLLLGKKYLCTNLIDKCIETLKDTLSVSNVMQIYQASEILDEPELHKSTEDYILHNANALILAGEISKMNKTDLCKLLKNDELNVAEIDLFNAVYSWGQIECKRINADSTNILDIKEILGDMIQLLRFTNMSVSDFSCEVVPKNVLPLEDTVSIFRFLTTPQEKRSQVEPSLDIRFNTTKRSLSYFVYNLKRLKGHGYDFGLKWQNFCFQTDRDVRIISLGFFRAIQPDSILEIGMRIQNQELTQTLAELIQENIKCPIGEDVIHIKFKQPIRIPKDIVHTISYIIKGRETFYKPSGESTIVANCGAEGRCCFKFTEAPTDSDLDQVPEICFRL